jgi:hypothetical protein
MNKTMIWQNIESFGLEYTELSFNEKVINVDGTVIVLENNYPYKVNYHITLDNNWVVKQLDVVIDHINQTLHLSSNGKGQWFDENGVEISHLSGAIDIDLSITPFTNTLPINRLKWRKQVPNHFEMVFISVPDLTVKKVSQSYELMNETFGLRTFKYKCGAFETNIEVDKHGLVMDYPGIFTRKY